MYSTPWYTYSQKYRKHLVLVIMRAQRPVEITVGHYYSLSLQSCELVGTQHFKCVWSPCSGQKLVIESTKIREASGSVAVYQKASPILQRGARVNSELYVLRGTLHRDSELAPRFWKIFEPIIQYLMPRAIT